MSTAPDDDGGYLAEAVRRAYEAIDRGASLTEVDYRYRQVWECFEQDAITVKNLIKSRRRIATRAVRAIEKYKQDKQNG